MALRDQGSTRPQSANGLSSLDAAERLERAGPNRLKPSLQRAVALQFLMQFKNPLVLVLLVASAISAITGDASGALIIGLIVLMSVTLDFVQSYRAGRAADRLALQVAVTAAVLRDGAPAELLLRVLRLAHLNVRCRRKNAAASVAAISLVKVPPVPENDSTSIQPSG